MVRHGPVCEKPEKSSWYLTVSVYVFSPSWARCSTTLLAGMSTSSSCLLTLDPGHEGINEDRQLLRGADPLPQQLELTLHLIETTLRQREL